MRTELVIDAFFTVVQARSESFILEQILFARNYVDGCIFLNRSCFGPNHILERPTCCHVQLRQCT